MPEPKDPRLTPPRYSVVVPVYNSEPTLPEFFRRLDAALAPRGPYEVVAVDDASRDGSWRRLAEAAAAGPAGRVRALQLMHNAGQARATLCGLAEARGDIVVTMDDDLQQPPEELPKLLDALERDPELDCVIGRYAGRHRAAYRSLGSALIRGLYRRAFGLPRHLDASSLRAMRSAVARALVSHRTANPVVTALLLRTTPRVANVDVEHHERKAGRSGYTFARQLSLALDSICNFTMFPLRAITATGAAVFLLSLLFSAALLARKLLGRITVPGWTTVVVLVATCSGLILLALGILGEYLVRIAREVGGAPRFVVRQRAGFDRE
jgi:glycosyltransferase involved in cell wall biosynthesis